MTTARLIRIQPGYPITGKGAADVAPGTSRFMARAIDHQEKE